VFLKTRALLVRKLRRNLLHFIAINLSALRKSHILDG